MANRQKLLWGVKGGDFLEKSPPGQLVQYFTRKIWEWGRKNYIPYPWRGEKNFFRLLLTEIFLQKTDSLKIKEMYPLIQQINNPKDILDNEQVLDYIVSKIGLTYKKSTRF